MRVGESGELLASYQQGLTCAASFIGSSRSQEFLVSSQARAKTVVLLFPKNRARHELLHELQEAGD